MSRNMSRRSFTFAAAGLAALGATACASSQQQTSQEGSARVGDLVAALSLEQKIAQMIMPAIRTWNKEDVTDLSQAPDLAQALQRHQYGGVILFGMNIVDTEQTVRLISDLQANNAAGRDAQQAAGAIPYLIAADQEGGSVARLGMGTRGTGSMALGATGEQAGEHALQTGQIFGEELAALGINVDLAPCLDIVTDMDDAGMSTRVFSDDPATVEACGANFAQGLAQSNVVACFKHFPGAGDGSDYPTAVDISLDQLRQQGLAAYSALIGDGASMLMTSAVTFPAFDDAVLLADGKTTGYYPATMSPKIVGQLLRGELGYDGVVMTDALEMDQFVEEPITGDQILPGKKDSVESGINIAEKCIQAGCDILLIPTDLTGEDAAEYYESYIAGIAERVQDGTIDPGLIDAAVRRILTVKEEFGCLDLDVSEADLEQRIAHALKVVGSAEHHQTERSIAEQAVTVLKDDGLLPLPGKDAHIVLLGRSRYDATPINYALGELQEAGLVDKDARITNNVTGEATGTSESTSIFMDRYYDFEEGLVYSDALSAAIADADYVVCLSNVGPGASSIQDDSDFMKGVSRALSEAKEAGIPFVLLSDNLPVDAARFPAADAVVCAYLPTGFDVDPTTRKDGSATMAAINANVPAALRAMFGAFEPTGTLPIDVPAIEQDDDGTWRYSDSILYERGTSVGA